MTMTIQQFRELKSQKRTRESISKNVESVLNKKLSTAKKDDVIFIRASEISDKATFHYYNVMLLFKEKYSQKIDYIFKLNNSTTLVDARADEIAIAVL